MGKNSGQPVHPLMKKWWIFLIVGPGIFFIIYFFMMKTINTEPPVPAEMPKQYALAGETVNTTAGQLKVGTPGELVFSKTVQLRNNLAVVESGRNFMIVPVSAMDEQAIIGTGHKWTALDINGERNDSLNVDPEVLAPMVNHDLLQVPPGWHTTYKLFKVRDSSVYYITLTAGATEETYTWRLP